MSSFVFNVAHGSIAELFIRGASGIVLLLTQAESDAVLQDYDTVEALLAAAGNVEASHASYARKTGVAGTVVVDDALDRTEVEIPNQTWAALQGAAIQKAIVAYELGASDAQRVPLICTTWPLVPDGNNATLRFP